MNRIDELLEEIARKEWGGRSLMQESRLSGGVFKYQTVALDYPWAKELSFGVEDITYTLRIARKMPQEGTWIPFCTAELTPTVDASYATEIAEILERVLNNKPDTT